MVQLFCTIEREIWNARHLGGAIPMDWFQRVTIGGELHRKERKNISIKYVLQANDSYQRLIFGAHAEFHLEQWSGALMGDP